MLAIRRSLADRRITVHHGLLRVAAGFLLNLIAHNLVRIPRLVPL
ncbi:MAG TPA: hypothetical protein VH855_22590 [Acetobacteraceae bacterium]|jgi:hypothetical protein